MTGESADDKMDGDDNSGPKRIVHRLRSDVKVSFFNHINIVQYFSLYLKYILF